MSKYNKLWVSLLGTAAIALNESGTIDVGQAEAIVTSGLALLTSFGVYQVKNTE